MDWKNIGEIRMKCINCNTEFKLTEQEAYVMKHKAHVDCPECGSYYCLPHFQDEIKKEESK